MSGKNVENITKSDSNFVAALVNHHVLPDTNFDWHCLIKNIFLSLKR